jgi:type II secretory ATPase GspE/PulE/Tfp pilus assembly ATPase PilB-like protein
MQPIKIIDDLYLPILAGLHIYPDESGVLHRIHRESNKICEVNKHKLCLPTDANLKSLSQQEYMFYHPMSENIANLIMEGGNSLQIADMAIKEGMMTLYRSGLEKARMGITSLAEVNRVTSV